MYRIITLAAALLFSTGTSFAQTQVSGQIHNNTTWTKAGSPYICSGLIEVDTHATLTIEPGAIIELDKNLDVYGGIIFEHNNTDITVIKSKSNNQTAPFIQVRNSNYTDSIVLKHYDFFSVGFIIYWPKSDVIIEECNFTKSNVTWRPTGTPTFVFENNKCTETDIHLSSKHLPPFETAEAESIIINNNVFRNSTFQAIAGEIDNKNIVEITNNTFKSVVTGIRLSTSGGMLISDNIFSKSVTAILHWPELRPVKIISNVFIENDEAIVLNNVGDSLEVINNTIYGNNVGIAISYNYKTNSPPAPDIKIPVITGNCIYGNNIAGIGWGGTNNITIGANWWGATDTISIDGMVYDNKDDFKRGELTYQPFLTQANPSCKTYSPPASTEEILFNKKEVHVFPNPVSNTLMFRSGSTITEVGLYDLVGKLVHYAQYNSRNVMIKTHEYPAGVYLYKIMTEDKHILTGKVIKQ